MRTNVIRPAITDSRYNGMSSQEREINYNRDLATYEQTIALWKMQEDAEKHYQETKYELEQQKQANMYRGHADYTEGTYDLNPYTYVHSTYSETASKPLSNDKKFDTTKPEFKEYEKLEGKYRRLQNKLAKLSDFYDFLLVPVLLGIIVVPFIYLTPYPEVGNIALAIYLTIVFGEFMIKSKATRVANDMVNIEEKQREMLSKCDKRNNRKHYVRKAKKLAKKSNKKPVKEEKEVELLVMRGQ